LYERPIIRQVGDIFVASGHDHGKWMFAAGPSFPGVGLPLPHDGALFFRTDLGAHYVYDAGTWTVVGGAGGPHATDHENGGADEIDVTGLSGLLADAQTAAAHTHVEGDVTGLVADLAAKALAARLISTTAPLTGGGDLTLDRTLAVSDATTGAKGVVELATDGENAASVVVQGNDARMSNARTPTAHDIITLHNGFPGGGTTFLRDDGTFAAPPAGGSPPTGTGFRHVTAGAEDAATKLVDTADINNDQVTPAKLDNGSGFSVLGKATTGSGDRADIVAADETVLGRTAAGNLTFAQVVTGQIANAAVTLAKIANIATARFLGRITAGSGVTEELTGTQATTLLDVFTSALKGLVPASGGGTTNFLRADGTFAAPPGGGITTLRTTGNQTINAGAGTFVDITGLTFAVVSGTDYAFEFYITFQSAQLTTGWKAGVNCPAGTLDFWAGSDVIANGAAGVATHTERHNVTRDDMTLLTSTVTNAVDLNVRIKGRYLCTANGTFAARFANELAANTDIVVQKGSWGTWF
jgi:hypothetical protein